MTHDQQFIKIGQEHRNGNKTQQREREGNARVSKTIHSISISGPEFHAIKQETSAARSNNNSRTINNGKQCDGNKGNDQAQKDKTRKSLREMRKSFPVHRLVEMQ